MTDFKRLLTALAKADVSFILVGGVAATAHGATRLTQDIDVVYERTPENIDRLVDAHEVGEVLERVVNHVSGLVGAPRYVLSVRLDDVPARRYDREIEATVYFCALEALQNASKYAGPDARVTIEVMAYEASRADASSGSMGSGPELCPAVCRSMPRPTA